jgi:AraC-like DNA-binding protein
MYLLPANLPIAYHCPNAMEQFYLHITLTTPDGFDMLSRIPKICQIPCPESLLTQLRDFSNLEDYGQMLRFKTLVSQSVTDCLLPENIPFPVKPYSHEVLQAISYMQNNLTIQLTGEQIAQAIFISPSRLYKRFRAETGLPIGTYLAKMIIHQATVLLADQKLTLKEISQQLGFCDQYYFSRRFKAQMDITPSHYRKLYLA